MNDQQLVVVCNAEKLDPRTGTGAKEKYIPFADRNTTVILQGVGPQVLHVSTCNCVVVIKLDS